MTKTRLLLLSFFIFTLATLSLPFAQYVFAADGNQTDNGYSYGTIPSKWSSETDFPLVVFNKGEAVFASSSWLDAVKYANNECLNADEDEAVLVVRSNVSESAADYNNWSYIHGTLIIDLMGNTISVEKNLIKPNDKSPYTTNVTVKNGNISLCDGARLIYYGSSATETNGVAGSEFNITFINTSIGIAENAKISKIVDTMNLSEKLPVISNLKFISCDLDFSTNAPESAITLFNLSADSSNHSARVTIDGGRIRIKNSSFVFSKIKKSGAAADSIAFTSSESGKNTELILPIGVDIPTNLRSVNNENLVFIKASEDEKTQTYELMTIQEATLRLKPKSSIVLGSELLYNVYIPNLYEITALKLGDVEYSLPSESVSKVVLGDLEYLCISAPLPAAQAICDISLEATVKIDERYAYGKWTLNLLKYATSVLKASASDEEKTLVLDVLAYIKSSYVYFESADVDIAIENIDGILEKHSGTYAISCRDSKSMEGLNAATLIFDYKPAIKLYINSERSANDYEFFSGGSKIETLTTGSDETGAYVLLDLYAYQMCQDVTYTTSFGASGSYSINNYYSYICKNDFKDDKKEDLLDLVRKFYNYSRSSAEYYLYRCEKDLSNSPVNISEYKIVHSADAEESIIKKAEKLSLAIKEKLGITIPVISDSEVKSNDKKIIIGASNLIKITSRIKLERQGAEDSFIVDFDERSIVIAGKTERSSLRAVEYFIEKYIDTINGSNTQIDVSDGRTQVKTFMCAGDADIVIDTVSTIFEVPKTTYTDGLYPSTVHTSHYPSIIELNHNGENNGKLLAIFCLSDTPQNSTDPDTNSCVMESSDGGQTWKMISRPEETFDTSITGISMAHLYELPAAVGDMPAGTILYSGNSVDYERKSHIAVWRSFDCGYTWEEYVIIDEGGGTREGVWEPFMWYEESDNYLYCFYSDDSDPEHDQKLVYKRTLDGVNWSEAVEVCAFKKQADRPGMFIMTKMGNGKYVMVYEYYGSNKGGKVYYKTTDDVSVWDAESAGTLLKTDNGYTVYGGPFCIWTPFGSENGILFASGKADTDGGQRHLLFVSMDYGKTWTTMENPLPYDISISVRGTNRIGHSPSFIVSNDPSVIYYVNTTVVAETGYQKIEFAKMKIYTNN